LDDLDKPLVDDPMYLHEEVANFLEISYDDIQKTGEITDDQHRNSNDYIDKVLALSRKDPNLSEFFKVHLSMLQFLKTRQYKKQ